MILRSGVSGPWVVLNIYGDMLDTVISLGMSAPRYAVRAVKLADKVSVFKYLSKRPAPETVSRTRIGTHCTRC
jgi:hypothetical protein